MSEPQEEVKLADYMRDLRKKRERERWDSGDAPNILSLSDWRSVVANAKDEDQQEIALSLLVVMAVLGGALFLLTVPLLWLYLLTNL